MGFISLGEVDLLHSLILIPSGAHITNSSSPSPVIKRPSQNSPSALFTEDINISAAKCCSAAFFQFSEVLKG